MPIYLVQHGRALPKDVDPGRGLSAEGRAEVTAVARLAAKADVGVKRIEHSGLQRAKETADLFAEALKPVEGVHPRAGLQPLDDVVPIARSLKELDQVMVVGHLPFMERLVAQAIRGNADRPVVKFVNGGIVCLDWEPLEACWVMAWGLVPSLAEWTHELANRTWTGFFNGTA